MVFLLLTTVLVVEIFCRDHVYPLVLSVFYRRPFVSTDDNIYLPPGGSPKQEIMKCSLCVRACVRACVGGWVRACVSVSRRLL